MKDTLLKKYFSILIAILIGVGIVFITITGSNITSTKNSNSPFDNNWKDSLRVIPQASPAKTLGVPGWDLPADTTATTTVTDIIAQRLLAEYLRSQQGTATTTISDETASTIANLLIQGIPSPAEKQYLIKDLNISSDNSREANIAYIEKINTATKNQFATIESDDEIATLIVALKTNDSLFLEKRLESRSEIWRTLIQNLLSIKTPSSVAQIHLHLVQSCEKIRVATEELKKALADPVAGVAALTKYRDGFNDVAGVRQEYKTYFINKF